ncbi:hypothetical protein C8R46DRAFT_1220609 [Mycena filopes]|nr:hypothetical protein C8R46DRAFT_1220609 [Mycena filopes]
MTSYRRPNQACQSGGGVGQFPLEEYITDYGRSGTFPPHILPLLEAIRRDGPFLTLIEYLWRQLSLRQAEKPYKYASTRRCLKYPKSTITLSRWTTLTIIEVLRDANYSIMTTGGNIGDGVTVPRPDQIVAFLVALWMRGNDSFFFSVELTHYLIRRTSKLSVEHVLENVCTDSGWQRLALMLNDSYPEESNGLMQVLWQFLIKGADLASIATQQVLLAAVVNHQASSPWLKACLIALVKYRLLCLHRFEIALESASAKHQLFPSTTVVRLSDLQSAYDHDPRKHKQLRAFMENVENGIVGKSAMVVGQFAEAATVILAEFLESFASYSMAQGHPKDLAGGPRLLASNVGETLRYLIPASYPTYGVHMEHQTRLARSIAAFLQAEPEAHVNEMSIFTMEALLPALGIPSVEVAPELSSDPPWPARRPTPIFTLVYYLQDPAARQIVKDSLMNYLAKCSPPDALHEKISNWGSDESLTTLLRLSEAVKKDMPPM